MQKRYRLLLQALLLATCLVVSMRAALYAAAEDEATAEPGLVIVSVDPAGPAAKAGIARGDILLAIDETTVNTVDELLAALAQVKAGTVVTLQVQHGDKTVEYKVTTSDQGPHAYLGIRPYGEMNLVLTSPDAVAAPVMPPTMPAAPSVGFPPTVGPVVNQLVVLDVLKGSAAAKAGIQVQDMITAVNGEADLTPQTLQETVTTLDPGDVITLTIIRADAEPIDMAVTLGKGADGQAQIGVQLGMMSVFDQVQGEGQPPAFLPMPPMMEQPFYFRQEEPAQRERRFFHFGRPFPPPQMYFFAMPYPGWPPPDFLQYEAMPYPGWLSPDFQNGAEGFTIAVPAQPGQSFAAPSVAVEIHREVQQSVPAEQEVAGYY